jgi:hypothetical protein
MGGRILLGVSLLAMAGAAAGGQAEICYSAFVPFAQATPPTNDTVFTCPIAGNKTLPQLATDGWEVVQITPYASGNGQQATQLVIQRRR